MKNNNYQEKKYLASSIKILEGLEAVRKRPGMYIGDTSDGTGLHHLIFEVLNNSIDEVLSGYCNKIYITIYSDNSISIVDNGRGIPVDIKMDDKNEVKRSAAEIVMTELHAGGKFDHNSYKISSGLHGVGISCVNALSKLLKLTIYRNNKKYIMKFVKGILQDRKIITINNIQISPIKILGNTNKCGTKIHFWVDEKIFSNIDYKYKILEKRVIELSFLNNGIFIKLTDKRNNKTKEFSLTGGTKGFVKYINNNNNIVNKNIFNIIKEKNIEKNFFFVDISMQWNKLYKEQVLCFTNNILQNEGGTHLTGLRIAMTKVINKYINKYYLFKKSKLEIISDDIREGLVCVLSIKIPEPKFSSQIKNKLISSEVRSLIEKIVKKAFLNFLLENQKDAKNICNKIILAAKTRKSLKKTKDIIKKRKNINKIILPSKLADCQEKNPSLSELYIVEGDSAGGSAKQGRDRKFQAILPLRGKVLNVEKASLEKIFSSEQIITLISTLGINIKNDKKNINKLRYNRIIIMTDADIDGAHIKTLLLTLFYRYMPELIKKGYIYIAQPPLYKIRFKKKKIYLKDNFEKEKYIIKSAIYKNIFLYKNNLVNIKKKIIKELFFQYKIINKIISKLPNNIYLIILKAIITGINIKLNTFKEISKSCLNLKKIINNPNIDIKIILNKINNKYYLEIKNYFYSNIKIIKIDFEFINSKNYKIINNAVIIIKKIIGKGIIIKKKDTEITKKIYLFNSYKIIKNILLNEEQNIIIQRYKGLGEMNPDQLWNTTMNPITRRLLKVNINDTKFTDKIFTILMGNKVEPRKKFIKINASKINNIDI